MLCKSVCYCSVAAAKFSVDHPVRAFLCTARRSRAQLRKNAGCSCRDLNFSDQFISLSEQLEPVHRTEPAWLADVRGAASGRPATWQLTVSRRCCYPGSCADAIAGLCAAVSVELLFLRVRGRELLSQQAARWSWEASALWHCRWVKLSQQSAKSVSQSLPRSVEDLRDSVQKRWFFKGGCWRSARHALRQAAARSGSTVVLLVRQRRFLVLMSLV